MSTWPVVAIGDVHSAEDEPDADTDVWERITTSIAYTHTSRGGDLAPAGQTRASLDNWRNVSFSTTTSANDCSSSAKRAGSWS